MRLLKLDGSGEVSLTNYMGENVPPYAILSHTWGPIDEEVTFRDLINGTGKDKPGYEKIRFCAELAIRNGVSYLWVDTCCIDQSSSSELSEAINSMFRYYSRAIVCWVYLADVVRIGDDENHLKSSFRKTRWLTRTWCLQELLAPWKVEFYSRDGKLIGSKDTLSSELSEITGINHDIILGKKNLSDTSIAERLSWSRGRETTKPEDQAYSLMGLFGVHMSLLYGEGMENALRRLEQAIIKRQKPQPNLFAHALTMFDHPRNALESMPIQMIGSEYESDRLSLASTDTIGTDLTVDVAVNYQLIQEFEDLLYEDQVMKKLLLAGLKDTNLSSDRVERHLSRALKMFARNLKDEAGKPEQFAAVAFVSSRSRIICRSLFARLLGQTGTLMPPGTGHNAVGEFLQTLSAAQPKGMKQAENDLEESDEDDNGEDTESNHDVLSELSKVKDFLRSSAAWTKLQGSVKDWIFPPWTERIHSMIMKYRKEGSSEQVLATISDDLGFADPNTIRVSRRNNESIVNWCKGQVEMLSQSRWDWSPLSNYDMPLEYSRARLSWQCGCGEVRTEVVPLEFALQLLQAVETYNFDYTRAKSCGLTIGHDTNSKDKATAQTRGSVVDPSSSSLGELGENRSLGDNSLENTSQEQQMSSASPQTLISSGSIDAQSRGQFTRTLHLFFVSSKGENDRLDQLAIVTKDRGEATECSLNDKNLFIWLKNRYLNHRGRLRCWFGIMQFSGCDFFRFNHHGKKQVSCHSRLTEFLPPEHFSDYEFTKVTQFPPISRHEFRKGFYRCKEKDPPSMDNKISLWEMISTGSWTLIIRPNSIELRPTQLPRSTGCRPGTCSVIQRLLKRKESVDEEKDDLDIFYGIYAREEFSFRHFLNWTIGMSSLSALFCFLWLFALKHNGDLQNALVLLSIFLPFMTLLFSPFLAPQFNQT